MAKPVGGLVCTCTPTLHRSFTRQNEDTATSLADYGRALHHKAEAKSIQWRAFVTMSCESIAAFWSARISSVMYGLMAFMVGLQ